MISGTGQLTLGIVRVLMMVLEAKFQRRRVLSLMMPKLGFKIESGTTKSEVSMRFFSKSTLRPWGFKRGAGVQDVRLTR